jgi:hypothetical protein
VIKLSSFFAAGLVAICALGATSQAQLVGKWKFKELNAGAQATAQQTAMAKTQLSQSILEFGADKSFSMTIGGKPGVAGKWTLTNRQIVIVPTAMGGQPVEKMKAQMQQYAAKNPQFAAQMSHMFDPLKATLSADGRMVTLMASAGKSGSVVYTKS